MHVRFSRVAKSFTRFKNVRRNVRGGRGVQKIGGAVAYLEGRGT